MFQTMAPQALAPDTVLRSAPWCVVREQEERHLVYNQRTDELHLLPHTGYYAYRLCDGWNTVGEIVDDLTARMNDDPAAVREGVQRFFSMLMARGILEVGT